MIFESDNHVCISESFGFEICSFSEELVVCHKVVAQFMKLAH